MTTEANYHESNLSRLGAVHGITMRPAPNPNLSGSIIVRDGAGDMYVLNYREISEGEREVAAIPDMLEPGDTGGVGNALESSQEASALARTLEGTDFGIGYTSSGDVYISELSH